MCFQHRPRERDTRAVRHWSAHKYCAKHVHMHARIINRLNRTAPVTGRNLEVVGSAFCTGEHIFTPFWQQQESSRVASRLHIWCCEWGGMWGVSLNTAQFSMVLPFYSVMKMNYAVCNFSLLLSLSDIISDRKQSIYVGTNENRTDGISSN